jgi:threonine aldolase
LLAHLAQRGVLATGLIGLRFVTHLDVDEADIDHALACIHQFFREQVDTTPRIQAAGSAVY